MIDTQQRFILMGRGCQHLAGCIQNRNCKNSSPSPKSVSERMKCPADRSCIPLREGNAAAAVHQLVAAVDCTGLLHAVQPVRMKADSCTSSGEPFG